MSVTRPAIPSLTGLRFIAAFLIVYTHSVAFFGQGKSFFLTPTYQYTNHIGMTLFFVLSGFVIHYNYSDAVRTKDGRYKFFIARFARLYPLYALFLMLDMSVKVTQIDADFWRALPFYLTLTQGWLPLHIGAQPIANIYAGGAWSISAEVFLYLLYIPAAILLLHRLRTVRAVVIAAVLWSAVALGLIAVAWKYLPIPEHSFGVWLVYVSPYGRLSEFALGVLVAHAFILHRATTKPVTPRDHLWLAAGLAALAIPIILHRIDPTLAIVMYAFGFAPGFAAIIWYVAAYRSAASRLLSSRPLVAGGDASYSLYFFHGWIFPMWFPGPTGELHYLWRLVMAWTLDIIIARGIFRVVEAPARAWLRRTLTRPGQKELPFGLTRYSRPVSSSTTSTISRIPTTPMPPWPKPYP